MTTVTKTFDWGEELHQTVVKSFATSFGLDFLLIEDKVGGDIDTIHNARHQVYATDKERETFANRGDYDSTAYHHHENYIAINREGKAKREAGTLMDTYTGEIFTQNAKTNLDHIKSAKEVHDDPGRVLADLNGPDLANAPSNLTHTNETLNKPKAPKRWMLSWKS